MLNNPGYAEQPRIGIALGTVTLGMGTNLTGLEDLHIQERLLQYIAGGRLKDMPSTDVPLNSRILEGKVINVDMTCPGELR